MMTTSKDSVYQQTWIMKGESRDHPPVTLVSPGNDPERFVVSGKRGGWREVRLSLALIFLASFLEDKLSYKFESAKQLADGDFEDALVGISCLPSSYLTGARLGEYAKHCGARSVVMGGIYAGALNRQILANQPSIDAVVRGPGERPLAAFIEGNPCPGLITRENHEASKDILPLERRPQPNRSLWPVSGEIATATYWQDGCPVAYTKPCIFCTTGQNFFSRRSPEQVVREMAMLQAQGIRYIEDGGDNFAHGGGATLSWLRELADLMQSEKLNFEQFFIHTSMDSLSYPGILEALHRIGVTTLQVGFESATPILTKCSSQAMRDVIPRAKAMGFNFYGTWILGMLGETVDSAKATIEQIHKMFEQGLLMGFLLDPLWPGPGSLALWWLCDHYPEWKTRDYIRGDEVMHAWFEKYTSLSFEQALAFREQVIGELWPMCQATGSMNM